MSMIGFFLAVSTKQIDELMQDAGSVADFLAAAVDDQDELGADFLDVDKSWHGIHFLLTGSSEEGEPPLKWVVRGPAQIGQDLGDGPARMLTSEQVIEVSKALGPITGDKLKKKCDWQLLNDTGIYPQGWRSGDESYIAENFDQLKKFYSSAARRRLAVVQWLS